MTRKFLRQRIAKLSAPRSTTHAPSPTAILELLEPRVMLSVGGSFDPNLLDQALPQAGALTAGFNGVTNPTPRGLTATQIRHAYGFDQITFTNSTVKATGAGQTIAIVDAYDDPNIAADLTSFDASMGVANTDSTGAFPLTKVMMAKTISSNAGWAMETALDVEWAHAMAPGAKILLVEAASSSYSDLFAAVNYARSQAGVVDVSMSWGSAEFSSEKSFDSYFTTPAGHIGGSGLAGGVVFIASSGDAAAPPEYPSVSPNVLSVGGTTLTITSAGNYTSEAGWSYSGGGISSYESKPSYQANVTQSKTARTSPDVAYDANPSSGFAVYNTVSYSGQTGWFQVGGTSAGAPQWAALIALTDQARALRGLGSLTASAALSGLYSLPAADFHDVTTGSNGYKAAAGYDLVTGRGSPLVPLLLQGLASTPTTLQTATQLAGTVVAPATVTKAGAPAAQTNAIFSSAGDQSPAKSNTGSAAWLAQASDNSWSAGASFADTLGHQRHRRA